MKEIIMIKYGELTTKKDNRNFFINTLTKNIESSLKDLNIKIIKDYYRMFIETENIEEATKRLSDIFGIHEIARCLYDEDRSIENIYKLSENLISENTTFKVDTNRSDKTYEIPSMEVSRKVGAYLLKNVKGLKVDVKTPNVMIYVEIRKEGVYVYNNGVPGKGGYPVGTLGKGLLMLSGGIDSVVAGYMALKRGVKLDFIYFESLPHTSLEARQKVIDLKNILKKYGNNCKLYIINFTKIQEDIYKNTNNDYLITLMRRKMYKIATKLAIKLKANAIFNGESIGQVASQTLTSIKVVNEVTSFPIIRPLASFDKLEIIKIANEIGTYETSIKPYEDCCTVFVPTHPVINPNLMYAKSEEEKLDNSLIENALKDMIIIEDKIEEKEEDIL